MDQFLLTSQARFEAARYLTNQPAGHRSSRLHGHGFLAQIRTAPPMDPALRPGTEVATLQTIWQNIVAPLDYRLLNDCLPQQPTDDNLAHWLLQQMPWTGIQRIRLHATPEQGMDVAPGQNTLVWRRYRFESAHQLPHVAPGHPCGRMHGHGFRVLIAARHPDTPTKSNRIDYDDLDTLWQPIQTLLHHRCLNDIQGLENPTSEVLSHWIWQQLHPVLPELAWVTVMETSSSGAHYNGHNYRIWKEMTLDSAVRLSNVQEDDPRRRIHGHTFTLRLHLSAPLESIMGWICDFGEVKKLFSPVFTMLDHHPLFEIPDLEDGDSLSIARWIASQSRPLLPQLTRLDLTETPGCGIILALSKAQSGLIQLIKRIS